MQGTNGQGTREPVIVFRLIDNILGTLHESGATFEQSMAALQAVEAILPTTVASAEQDVSDALATVSDLEISEELLPAIPRERRDLVSAALLRLALRSLPPR